MSCHIYKENGAAMPLRPACGEKVAGRPDEGRGFYTRETGASSASSTKASGSNASRISAPIGRSSAP